MTTLQHALFTLSIKRRHIVSFVIRDALSLKFWFLVFIISDVFMVGCPKANIEPPFPWAWTSQTKYNNHLWSNILHEDHFLTCSIFNFYFIDSLYFSRIYIYIYFMRLLMCFLFELFLRLISSNFFGSFVNSWFILPVSKQLNCIFHGTRKMDIHSKHLWMCFCKFSMIPGFL